MVGNLDSGDYTIVSFSLVPLGRGENGVRTLEVQMDYTDSIGERRSVVKEIQFSSDLAVGMNITVGQRPGNYTGGTFQRGSASQQSNSSIFKSVWFWVIVVVVVGGGYYLYRKHPEKVKHFFSGTKKNKSGSEKNSKGIPDWVIAERTKKK